MKRLLFLATIVAAGLLAGCGDSAVEPVSTVSLAQGQLAANNTYIVVLKPGHKSERVRDLASSSLGKVKHVYQRVLRGGALVLPPQAAEALSRNPMVQSITPDALVQASDLSWGLDRIDQRKLPLDGSYNPGQFRGAGVTIYILDTGVRSTHSEFIGRIQPGVDFIEDGNGTEDCKGHGTHVAGTAAGSSYGVAPAATVVSVRVLNCQGQGSVSDVIAGVDWVTVHAQKPAVANMSLGGTYYQALNDAITASIASGVVYALAAGNNNTDACSQSPAATPNALTVGATEANDARASFSNWGMCVDLFAPGVEILSAFFSGDQASITMSGTSMATPHVAGMAARYLSENPFATPATVSNAILEQATFSQVTDSRSPSTQLLYDVFGSEPNNPEPSPNKAPYSFPSMFHLQGMLRVTMQQQGYDLDGEIVRHVMTWGDGWTNDVDPRLVNPQPHNYATAGTYHITSTVFDNVGQSHTVVLDYPVSLTETTSLPKADFTYSCTGSTCAFNSISTDANGQVTFHQWNFGDGTIGTGTSVQHTYAGSGNYEVQLNVLDDEHAGDRENKVISVDGAPPPPPPVDNPPVASFRLDGCSADLLCQFTSTSTDDNLVGLHRWDFGDGTVVSNFERVIRHDYADKTKKVTVTLQVTDNAGQTSQVSLNLNFSKQKPRGKGKN